MSALSLNMHAVLVQLLDYNCRLHNIPHSSQVLTWTEPQIGSADTVIVSTPDGLLPLAYYMC